MRRMILMALAAVAALTPCSTISAAGERSADTLWIFDADFEDTLGDNAGWTSEDWSGSPPSSNYWHKDTIRIGGFEYLGDSTWWCGTYDNCGLQPRGYGNNWTCALSRSFPEVTAVSQPGDELVLEYDQRWAMEACYDYGYTDISSDGGETWITRTSVTNPGFACSVPGPSEDWDASGVWWMNGHTVLDLSEYAGQPIELRFRFESDDIYSSQDAWDNPPLHSCLDGAWQLDNIAWYVNDEQVWLDDCESTGKNGWSTENASATGQTGLLYERRHVGFDGRATWAMAAYDTASGDMVAGQLTALFTPPIGVAGADYVVVRWEGWVDLPDGDPSRDFAWFRAATYDALSCAERHVGRPVYTAGYLRDELPHWTAVTDSIACHGRNWLVMSIQAHGMEQASGHGAGFVVDKLRVGLPLPTGVDEAGTLAAWILSPWPNPFSDATSVRYGLATRGHVTLSVYDLSGRAVRTLVDSEVEAGTRTATWDGTTDSGERAASGVYFLKLEARAVPDLTVTRKLVLLK